MLWKDPVPGKATGLDELSLSIPWSHISLTVHFKHFPGCFFSLIRDSCEELLCFSHPDFCPFSSPQTEYKCYTVLSLFRMTRFFLNCCITLQNRGDIYLPYYCHTFISQECCIWVTAFKISNLLLFRVFQLPSFKSFKHHHLSQCVHFFAIVQVLIACSQKKENLCIYFSYISRQLLSCPFLALEWSILVNDTLFSDCF